MQLNWLDEETPTPAVLSAGFPEKMVLLDVETTGGKATHHRIIEIGLVVIEQGEVVERWQSFIDPETMLPPFIQKLTGIAPSNLRGAPLFSQVADKLLTYLDGRTLVAHNARFDYSFLKNEFERIGVSYNAKPLCSVKFSRSLYPQFIRHGLDQIIQRFQLPIENRHRAMDDAEMIQRFFLKSSALFSEEEISATCASLLKNPALPPLLKASALKKLPASAGVYYFYDANGALLYVGKSVNIRTRVMSHFSGDHSNPKDLQINNKLAHIEFDKTPTDLGAQIRERVIRLKRCTPCITGACAKPKSSTSIAVTKTAMATSALPSKRWNWKLPTSQIMPKSALDYFVLRVRHQSRLKNSPTIIFCATNYLDWSHLLQRSVPIKNPASVPS